jgi:hypothetical protein
MKDKPAADGALTGQHAANATGQVLHSQVYTPLLAEGVCPVASCWWTLVYVSWALLVSISNGLQCTRLHAC